MRSRTLGPSSPRHSLRRGRPPVVTRACGSSDARPRRHELPLGHRGPPIPSTESAREQSLGDDLFHEPEAQPKFVTAEAPPPETTVGGHHCGKWLPSVIQAPFGARTLGHRSRQRPLCGCPDRGTGAQQPATASQRRLSTTVTALTAVTPVEPADISRVHATGSSGRELDKTTGTSYNPSTPSNNRRPISH